MKKWDSQPIPFCGYKRIVWVDKDGAALYFPNNWPITIKCLKCQHKGYVLNVRIMGWYYWRWEDFCFTKITDYYYGCEMCGEPFISENIKILCYKCNEFRLKRGDILCEFCVNILPIY